MSITIITNTYTGYTATIKSANAYPSVSTVRKHLRRAKASDCRSITTIFCDGEGMDIADFGHGPELVRNGQMSH